MKPARNFSLDAFPPLPPRDSSKPATADSVIMSTVNSDFSFTSYPGGFVHIGNISLGGLIENFKTVSCGILRILSAGIVFLIYFRPFLYSPHGMVHNLTIIGALIS